MAGRYSDQGDGQPPLDDERRTTTAPGAGWGWWWLWIFFFALFFFGGWGWWGWGWNSGPRNTAYTQQQQVQNRDPLRQYVGREVSISGEAASTDGAHAFVLQGDNVLGAEKVLVITKQPIDGTQKDASGGALNVTAGNDRMYRVQGHVRIFDHDDIEKEIGAKLNDFDYTPYENKPVIVAENVKSLVPAR